MAESKVALTLVIPTYNEEKRLPLALQTVADWIPQSRFDVEVIIVDDGSKDATRQVAESFRTQIPNLQFIEVSHVGQMNATITGLKRSNRPWRATLEADCPVHPRMLESFVKDFSGFDIVMGSRILHDDASAVEGKSLFRRILSFGMSRLFSILFRGGIRDPQIGFKLYKAEILDQILPLLTLRHDGLKSAEIVVKAVAFGYQLKEVPVRYKHDEDSRCVPKGNHRVVFQAASALFELWAKSYVEYKRGDLPTCPVRFGFLLQPFWRLMNFRPLPLLPTTETSSTLP
jgi:glycosyltransferase involved in cell wall biosynthesis